MSKKKRGKFGNIMNDDNNEIQYKEYNNKVKIYEKTNEIGLINSVETLRKLEDDAGVKFHDIKKFFNTKDWKMTLKIGNDLLKVSKDLPNSETYQTAIYRFIALTYLSLEDYDHALIQASRMIQTAKSSQDVTLITRSLAVLGQVHLKIGHLDEAAKAWESLSIDLTDPLPKAWLFHEIGRCYYEISNYSKAFEMAKKCIKCAKQAHSIKWICYGRLLNAQLFIKSGKLQSALKNLQFVNDNIQKEINNNCLIHHTQKLLTSVNRTLQRQQTNSIDLIQ